MTLNPKSLPKGYAKRKSVARGNRMTVEEEKSVAKAYQDIKEGKIKTFKNVGEYLEYLNTI